MSIPESVLHKKHNAINYHVVQEAVAANILRDGKEDGQTNLADLLTKIVPGQHGKKPLTSQEATESRFKIQFPFPPCDKVLLLEVRKYKLTEI